MKSALHKTKIAFFMSNLDVGGIQRSAVALLQNIDPKKYSIELFLLRTDGPLRSALPDYVRVRKLKGLPVFAKLVPFRIAKMLFEKRYQQDDTYDVAIDYDGYQAATALAALGSKAKRHIGWVHGNYAARIASDWKFRILFHAAKSKYSMFTKIAVVSDGLADGTARLARIPKDNISVVNNFIDTKAMDRKSQESVDIIFDSTKYNLVSVCRLVQQKGVDQTLYAFASAHQKNNNIHLYIVGDGPERAALESQAKELAIDNSVTFLGQRSNPYNIMKHMDGYISTSWHEGQGISTLEAKSFDLDIFIPRRLEKYSYNVRGVDDVAAALIEASQTVGRKKYDGFLKDYNTAVLQSFDAIVTGRD